LRPPFKRVEGKRTACWLAQELPQALGSDLGEAALVPGCGVVFVVRVDGGLSPP